MVEQKTNQTSVLAPETIREPTIFHGVALMEIAPVSEEKAPGIYFFQMRVEYPYGQFHRRVVLENSVSKEIASSIGPDKEVTVIGIEYSRIKTSKEGRRRKYSKIRAQSVKVQ